MQINILSENQIKEVAREEIRKELSFIYGELDKLRVKISDLENIKIFSIQKLKGG